MIVDWPTKIIFIPQSDLTHVDGDMYRLDVNWFWEQLHQLQYSEAGMSYPNIFVNYPPVELSGIEYARIIKIINGPIPGIIIIQENQPLLSKS